MYNEQMLHFDNRKHITSEYHKLTKTIQFTFVVVNNDLNVPYTQSAVRYKMFTGAELE